jgi:hypothetical protein
MKIPIDEHGQPTLHSKKENIRLDERKIDEMIGICKGIIVDNEVTQQEVDFLFSWLKNNIKISHLWPANILYQRIDKALRDNFIDQDEKKELFDTLRQITGEPNAAAINMSTKLPFTDPLPIITFEKQYYCFTGHFVTGTRKQVEDIVIKRSGNIQKSPTRKTNYLVIGLLGSSDWIHSTYGRKIEKAIKIKESYGIKIVSEEYWSQFIK